ncbi:hypothetical protein HER10_EVM0010267 [Colletotrichum scovillei]|uniref:Uncharacterized protein n=1 Tax=Colletotrichum scovillei TaxID=1209932 RepID=A0A9P7UHK2_9PEZI|nr:uncharacterized protein HER10_EVM0010267 [Colletotrichum scovillei]KAF4780215.1 hypothetical protein HER10_EVM0010267 [Colletotrichum scovillei]KAG7058194.1 hypothetical protein JMJ77_0005572 [Colletotrichum scovillei]KAG7083796.1 hypothetical protein JMJ78_0009238 [Colletotrichum scovillei]
MAETLICSPFQGENTIFSFGHEKTSKYVDKCLVNFASAITEASDDGYKDAITRLQHSFMQWALKIMGEDRRGDLNEKGEKIFDENLAKPGTDPNFRKRIQMYLELLWYDLIIVREMLKKNPTVGNKILGEKPTTNVSAETKSESGSKKEDLEASLGPKSTLGTLLFQKIPMLCKFIRNDYAEFSGDFKEGVVPSHPLEYMRSKAQDALDQIDPPNYPSLRPAKEENKTPAGPSDPSVNLQ